MRSILFFGLVILVFLTILIFMQRLRRNSSVKPDQTEKNQSNDTIERCEVCGTFSPSSETVQDEFGHHFCNQKHLEEFNKD